MNILLALTLRVASVFLTPLLIAFCLIVGSMLPLIGFFVMLYFVAWAYDIDREKRLDIRTKKKKEVKH